MYTDLTKVGENYRKKEHSVFATAWMKPTAAQLAGGVVLGLLPENCFITHWNILKQSTNKHDQTLSGNLHINGQAIDNKLYPQKSTIEYKSAGQLDEQIMIVITYIEVELSNGKLTPLPDVILASDGTVAK